jgi:hypothetical protein
LLACPAIGIDFDSCALDIVPFGFVAALSLAVSAGLVVVCGGVEIAGGMLAAGGGVALETAGETVVDGLSPHATSAAAVAIAISGQSRRIIDDSKR